MTLYALTTLCGMRGKIIRNLGLYMRNDAQFFNQDKMDKEKYFEMCEKLNFTKLSQLCSLGKEIPIPQLLVLHKEIKQAYSRSPILVTNNFECSLLI